MTVLLAHSLRQMIFETFTFKPQISWQLIYAGDKTIITNNLFLQFHNVLLNTSIVLYTVVKLITPVIISIFQAVSWLALHIINAIENCVYEMSEDYFVNLIKRFFFAVLNGLIFTNSMSIINDTTKFLLGKYSLVYIKFILMVGEFSKPFISNHGVYTCIHDWTCICMINKCTACVWNIRKFRKLSV